MTNEEIRKCEQIIELFNKTHFLKLKPGRMLEYVKLLQEFGMILKKYKDLNDNPKQIDTPIQKRKTNGVKKKDAKPDGQ